MSRLRNPSLLTIGEFSRLSRLSVKALRHYHDVGLLVPEHVDQENGYRYYMAGQLASAMTIALLRSIDLPLADINAALTASPDTTASLLEAHRDRLSIQLKQGEQRLALTHALITKENDLMYDVTIETVPATRIVYEAVDGPSDLSAVTEAATLAALAARLSFLGIEPVAQPILVIHEADELRTREDVCLPIGDAEITGDGFRVGELPREQAATVTHIGSLNQLVLAVNAVMGWIGGRGHHVAMPFRVHLLSIPPLFTVASAGGGDQPVAKIVVPFRSDDRDD